MKKILLLVGIIVSLITIAQDNYNNVIFKFNNKYEFTNQFQNKTTEKNYSFIISGIESDNQAIKIKQKIGNYRGVLSFSISAPSTNGERNAELKLYKYADHWKYYEFLFSNNGINRIMINNTEYRPSELENN